MADQKVIKKGFSLKGYDLAHIAQTEEYAKAVDALYQTAVKEYAKLAAKISIDPDKPFKFSDYPQTKAKAKEITDTLSKKMKAVIIEGNTTQWNLASKKNDAFLDSILDTSKLKKSTLSKFQDRNLEALSAFQNRKVNGIDLSDRIWKYTGQLKTTMELGIDVGLGKGISAQDLSKELRKYLNDPERLYRRVRDKRGQLQLSKNAKAFNPGQGVYRSSYKNAMRLTRSEINMAYRTADQLRWNQLDFVVGYEVRLSNNHTLNGVPFVDICDDLKGKYPKEFKFMGWHPQCRCQAFPILMKPDEFDTDELNELKSALDGTEYKKYQSKEKVVSVPQNFLDWAEANRERSAGWKSQPYFIRDNYKGGTIEGGFKFATNPTKTTTTSKPAIAQEKVAETQQNKANSRIPNELSKDSAYLKGQNFEFSNEFFSLLDENKPVTLKFSKSDKSFFMPPNTVQIGTRSRIKKSPWFRENLVYHEYGHAIDHQKGLRFSNEIKDLMSKYRTSLAKEVKYTKRVRAYDYEANKLIYKSQSVKVSELEALSIKLTDMYSKIYKMSDQTFIKRGITKSDALESILALADTVCSLNPNYGFGHSRSYFSRSGNKEAEFIAHCFENSFGGNPVFKKYLPNLYNDMIGYIKKVK
jgi:hypothetical protein